MLIEKATLEEISEKITQYYLLLEEIRRLEMSKAIARDTLLEAFKVSGTRVFDTDTGLRARVDTQSRRFIGVKEAEVLLPPDLFGKLVKESTNIVLTVKPIKEKQEDDKLET